MTKRVLLKKLSKVKWPNSFYLYIQQQDTIQKELTYRDVDETVPVSDELLKRESQGGVLSHLQDWTPAVIFSNGGVAAVRHLKRKLLQNVHLICSETVQEKIQLKRVKKLCDIQTSCRRSTKKNKRLPPIVIYINRIVSLLLCVISYGAV